MPGPHRPNRLVVAALLALAVAAPVLAQEGESTEVANFTVETRGASPRP